MSLMKITNISLEEFNTMSKDKLYRQIETVVDDEQVAKDWLKYRGTPNAEVFKIVRREGSVIWRVEV